MFLQNCSNYFLTAALSTLALFFVGCNPPKPTVYVIPKEERSTTALFTPEPETSPAATDPAPMQVLPGMRESAESAPGISYDVPAGWKALGPNGIRKANFTIVSDLGSCEVTVLTFPGDVGGALANINRWRAQIGLPATSENVDTLSEPYEIAGHSGRYVQLEGDSQSILGAILPFHGNTWFFKMLGDTSVVRANDAAMRQFLDSVRFTDHAHK